MAELSPHQVVPPRSRSDFMAATRDGGGGPAAITCAHSLSNEKLNMARSRMRSRSTYDPRRKRRTNACRRRDGCELGCRSAPLPINKARPRAPQRTTSPSIGIALHNNRRTTTYGTGGSSRTSIVMEGGRCARARVRDDPARPIYQRDQRTAAGTQCTLGRDAGSLKGEGAG
jgi:hypothetical protein